MTRRTMTSILLGTAIGTPLGLYGLPWIEQTASQWVGNLMLQAVHQHWLWEQAQARADFIQPLANTKGREEM